MSGPLATPVSAERAADLLGITSRHLRRLVADGWIKKDAKGKFTDLATVRGYVAYLQDEARRTSKSAAASKKDDAKTREIEQRIAIRDRTLVSTEEAIAFVDAVVGGLKSDFSGLAMRVSRDRVVRRKIESVVDDILNRASNRYRDGAAALRTGGDASGVAGADDAR